MCTYIWYQYTNPDLPGNPDKPNHLRRSACKKPTLPQACWIWRIINPLDHLVSCVYKNYNMYVYVYIYIHRYAYIHLSVNATSWHCLLEIPLRAEHTQVRVVVEGGCSATQFDKQYCKCEHFPKATTKQE